MGQHTPGPWQWYWRVEDGEANCGVFYEEREGMATSVCRAPRYVTKKQWEANATLIAAAPQLLEALIGLLPVTFTGHPTREQEIAHWQRERDLGNGNAEAVLAAFAALRAATGDQS